LNCRSESPRAASAEVLRFSDIGGGSKNPDGKMNCWADLSKMLTCNLKGQSGLRKGQMDTYICSPRRSVISDLNGQIENILPKRVARRSSKIELGREPSSVLSDRIRIESVAYRGMEQRGNSVAISALGGKMARIEGKNRPGQLATLGVYFSACPPRIPLRSSEI
jgi:hypothetical protein